MRIIILLLLAGVHVCYAQNLILNPDFELHSGCPTNVGQIYLATSWQNPTSTSPDYLNVCSTDNNTRVPSNGFGYQHGHSGSAYGGLALFYPTTSPPDFREYVQATFSAPLVAGKRYRFEMYVSSGDIMQYKLDQIGVYFSNVSITVGTSGVLPFVPQIVGNFSLVDTSSWTLISGNYVAQGGERFLLIGNFNTNANTTYTMQGGTAYNASYAFLDDVSLVLDDTCATISLSINASVTTPQLNNGVARVLASGGQPPYQYSLDSLSFQAGNMFSSLAIGTYQVYVVDSAGCTASGTFNIDLTGCCPGR